MGIAHLWWCLGDVNMLPIGRAWLLTQRSAASGSLLDFSWCQRTSVEALKSVFC